MVADVYGSTMSDAEIDTFLHRQGTGVLSLAREGSAYAIPVSYGYDHEGERCILDLGFGPQSKKRQWLHTTEGACLTVYDIRSAREWASVVLEGAPRKLEDEKADEAADVFYEHAEDVGIAVFDHPPKDIELQWYAFDIDVATGRASDSPENRYPEGRHDSEKEL